MLKNKKHYQKSVLVAQALAPNLSSRNVFVAFERAIRDHPDYQINFDFSGVAFISRSAAHALSSMQDKSEGRVVFSNLSNEVESYINKTKKSKTKTAASNVEYRKLFDQHEDRRRLNI